MAQGCIIIAKCGEGPHDFHSRCVTGHQHLALLQVSIAVVRVAFAHHDENRRALVHGVGGKPLATVKHPFVAVSLYTQFNVGCIGTGYLGFRHRISGAYLACEQGTQPLRLLGLAAVLHEHFHVAGVRGVTIEHLR